MVVAIERYVRDEPPDLSKMLEVELAQSDKTANMKRALDDEFKTGNSDDPSQQQSMERPT